MPAPRRAVGSNSNAGGSRRAPVAESGGGRSSFDEELDLMVLEYLGHVGYDRAVEQAPPYVREKRQMCDSSEAQASPSAYRCPLFPHS